MDVLEEVREMKFSEMDEQNEYTPEDAVKELRESREDFQRMIEIMSTAHVLAEMFVEDVITFGEYLDLTEYLAEQEKEVDSTLL